MYWTTLEISAPRCALMCYPSSNITYCIACLLCIGVILLNKFNQSINQSRDRSAHTAKRMCPTEHCTTGETPRARTRAKVVISCSTFSNADHCYCRTTGTEEHPKIGTRGTENGSDIKYLTPMSNEGMTQFINILALI